MKFILLIRATVRPKYYLKPSSWIRLLLVFLALALFSVCTSAMSKSGIDPTSPYTCDDFT
jgi:hypothetical protein